MNFKKLSIIILDKMDDAVEEHARNQSHADSLRVTVLNEELNKVYKLGKRKKISLKKMKKNL